MPKKKVLVVGYGSIGKRHVTNLIKLGIKPHVLTKYADSNEAFFYTKLPSDLYVDYAIIATPTDQHLSDVLNVYNTGCRKILVEKPIEINLSKCKLMMKFAEQKNLSVFCAYNLRFLKVIQTLKNLIKEIENKICIVQITCGQYLPEWRPTFDYRNSYSAKRDRGGGADLDISHEIDYMCWLFGYPEHVVFTRRDNLSSLSLDSPDYFFGMYRYSNFVVNTELDYIRKKERTIKIIGENNTIVEIDFIRKKFKIDGIKVDDPVYFNLEDSYCQELMEFLDINPPKNLATAKDAENVLMLLQSE